MNCIEMGLRMSRALIYLQLLLKKCRRDCCARDIKVCAFFPCYFCENSWIFVSSSPYDFFPSIVIDQWLYYFCQSWFFWFVAASNYGLNSDFGQNLWCFHWMYVIFGFRWTSPGITYILRLMTCKNHIWWSKCPSFSIHACIL